MTIQHKELVFDSIYLFGAMAVLIPFARSASLETFQALVFVWIVVFWLIRLFFLRCPKCDRPVRYMFWPQFTVVRCGRCGAWLVEKQPGVDLQTLENGWPAKKRNQHTWQVVQLIGALLLFNCFLVTILDSLLKAAPGFIGWWLLLLLCLNSAFVFGSRPKPKSEHS